MKRNTNNLILYSLIFITFIFLYACTNGHDAQDGHDHDRNLDLARDEHDGESTVSLTQSQIRTVGIKVGLIEQKELSAGLRANGFLRVPNNNKAIATSLIGGIIKTLQVQIGDYVKKGQVIATVSNPELIELQEEYIRIKSSIEFAELELRRQTELYEGNVGAKKNLQNADKELNNLVTRKASLHQQLKMMGINSISLSNSSLKTSVEIKTPISGTVTNVFAKIGSYVDVSFPIIELVENTNLHLDLQVFEKDLPLVKIGQKIDFVVTNNPNKNHVAEVYKVGSSFDTKSKTIAIHSKVVGDKSGLIDGMNVTGIVNLDKMSSPAVPSEAIVNADGKYYIFLVKGKLDKSAVAMEGKKSEYDSKYTLHFEKVEVVIGTSALGYTAVTPVNEIRIGSPIVVKGAFFVNAKLSNKGEGHTH